MIEELAVTARQTGFELIDISDTLAEKMETWGDVLDKNPDSITATLSAGFINKPTEVDGLNVVIDVQAPPDEKAVLRTWAVEAKIGDDQKQYFNNIQLTFDVDDTQVHELISKGKSITRDDIRRLLQSQTSQLAHITVSNESGSDGADQAYGERYDFAIAELRQLPDEVTKVNRALQTVLQSMHATRANG